jgi:hypothetical protein
MIRIENRTGLGGSTQRLHHKHTGAERLPARDGNNELWCAFDGGDI